MADFQQVPILDVLADNCREIWPAILLAVRSSTFVAIDMELSGLGDRKRLNAKSMDERYTGICDIAKSRSVVSIGLSCFKLHSHESGQPNNMSNNEGITSQTDMKVPKVTKLNYQVQTFNVILLCSEEYVVDPTSLKFLVHHGFDFNKQYAKGIPYYRGHDKKPKELRDTDAQLIRNLLCDLIRNETPVVFHNALVDLVFLYQNFYANTPGNMSTFLADLAEMFPNGVFDTKYITEYKARFPASYLEYIFRRCQRDNYTNHVQQIRHVEIFYLNYPENMVHLNYLPCGVVETESSTTEKANVCIQFAHHGWCAQGGSCPLSHDVDKILDNEHLPHAKRRGKRKKKAANQTFDSGGEFTDNSSSNFDGATSGADVSMESIEPTDDSVPEVKTGNKQILPSSNRDVHSSRTEGHRAGFDAFMTGFVFAHFIATHGRFRTLSQCPKLSDLGMQDFKNRVILSGKDIPLQIVKSNFAKNSKEHTEKIDAIKSKA